MATSARAVTWIKSFVQRSMASSSGLDDEARQNRSFARAVDQHPAVAALVVALANLALKLPGIAQRSLWLDEAWTTAMRRVEKLSGMETVRKMNGGLLPYTISLAPPSPAAPSPSLQPSTPAHYMGYRLLSSTPLHRF